MPYRGLGASGFAFIVKSSVKFIFYLRSAQLREEREESGQTVEGIAVRVSDQQLLDPQSG